MVSSVSSDREELSRAQISALAIASVGHDIDIAVLRRLGLDLSDARRQLGELSREELQEATGASRSSVINALEELISSGIVEATAPARSPNRRYRRARS